MTNDTITIIQQRAKKLANDPEFGKYIQSNSLASVEHPGYMATWHETPKGMEPAHHVQILRESYTRLGKLVLHTLAAPRYKGDWFKDGSVLDAYGIEVIWRTF